MRRTASLFSALPRRIAAYMFHSFTAVPANRLENPVLPVRAGSNVKDQEAAMSSYIVKQTDGDTSWFIHDRFGMFIHFGLYSCGARGEWFKSKEELSDDSYDRYFRHFDPDLFDARQWAQRAKAAGMKYAVLTAKHNDGFCLFDSRYTDYKSTNTPAGRDFVKEYVKAFREAGLKVGIYYSLIDWHHSDYQIDVFHPLRRSPGAQAANETRSMERYREYLTCQVKELLCNYGKLDIFWFDFTYPDKRSIDNEANQFAIHDYQSWMPWTTQRTWHSSELIAMMRSLQPHLIINDRAGIAQDISTPEQTMMEQWPKYAGSEELSVWEACHTFSGAWGYARDEMSWKTPETLIRILIQSVSSGGNLIMNVGPTGRGCFDERAEQALEVYAQWMSRNSRSIYGCTKAEPEFTPPSGTLLTQSQNGKRLYIHLVDYPYAEMHMQNLADRIEYAQFLHDASEIQYRRTDGGAVRFLVPGIRPKQVIPVIEVFVK